MRGNVPSLIDIIFWGSDEIFLENYRIYPSKNAVGIQTKLYFSRTFSFLAREW